VEKKNGGERERGLSHFAGGATLPGQPRPSPPPCLTRRTCGHGPPTHTPRARRVPQLTTASITGAPPSTPPRPAVGRRTDAPLRRTSVIVRRAGWRPRRGMDVKECACVCEKCRLLLCRGLPHQQRALLLASALLRCLSLLTSRLVESRAPPSRPAASDIHPHTHPPVRVQRFLIHTHTHTRDAPSPSPPPLSQPPSQCRLPSPPRWPGLVSPPAPGGVAWPDPPRPGNGESCGAAAWGVAGRQN